MAQTATAQRTGKVVQVIGPVIDIEFPEGLPEIYNAVRVVSDGGPGVEKIDVVAEVEQHLGENRVRAIAMKPTDGMTRGMTALDTGWRWQPNGNNGEYNAAYDIWLGTSNDRASFSGYLMVWFREPPGQQPAGQRTLTSVTVENVPGTWDIWTGRVGNRPIINWVRAEGQDTLDMEFDILDFVRDAETRGLQVPGTHVLSVAVGFEMWSPVTNLVSSDFYVDVK